MNNYRISKKVLFICGSLIIIVLIILVLSRYKKIDNIKTEEYSIKTHYGVNEINYIYISEEVMAKKYLNDYSNIILTNPELAYELINDNYKIKKFGSLEKFKEYLNIFIKNSSYGMSVDKYSVSNIDTHKIYNIIDKGGNQYIFKEKSIMNYEVFLDDYTTEIK